MKRNLESAMHCSSSFQQISSYSCSCMRQNFIAFNLHVFDESIQKIGLSWSSWTINEETRIFQYSVACFFYLFHIFNLLPNFFINFVLQRVAHDVFLVLWGFCAVLKCYLISFLRLFDSFSDFSLAYSNLLRLRKIEVFVCFLVNLEDISEFFES